MPELRTADCTRFLAADPHVQQLVRDRLGLTDDPQLLDGDDEERAYVHRAAKDARDPRKWKRTVKVKLGSKSDLERNDYAALWPQYANGGVARVFWLQGTDSIAVLLVEHEGKIVVTEDMSD